MALSPIDGGIVANRGCDFLRNRPELLIGHDPGGAVALPESIVKRDLVVQHVQLLAFAARLPHFLAKLDECLNDLSRLQRAIVITRERLLQLFGESA